MTTARFNPRDPLTERTARTLRETTDTRYSWWVSAEAAIAEEDYIRAMFADQDRQASELSHKWAFRFTCFIGAGVLIWLAVERFAR